MKWVDKILNFLSNIKCKCKSGCGGEMEINTPAVTGNDIKENKEILKALEKNAT
tara:strand:- start:70 stop:231 length:162 start_codon:yes stop_codon:yes gene_type:complete